MNTLKNVVKKAIAVSAGVVMLGATTAGALAAADLSTYPAPFIQNGQLNAKIVVGEKAASSDIIGAIDIAASLQASAVTPVGTGSSSQTVLTGDVKQIGDSSNKLEIGEQIGAVTETLTDSDLQMLKSGSLTTQKGSTDFTQTLDLTGASAGSNEAVLKQDNHDNTGLFLYFKDGQPVYTYSLEFTSGLQSKLASGVAKDLEDTSIYMLGQWYTISNADVGATSLDLTMLAGDVTDTLAQGETKTYEINGKSYEVQVLVIGTSSGDTTVKFYVNGEATDALASGDTYQLNDGTEIGVRDIVETSSYYQGAPSSIVEFFLGANKVEISDSNFGTQTGNARVKINDNSITHLTGDLVATEPSATEFRLNSIELTMTTDAAYRTDVYLAPGEGLRAQLNDPTAMIGNWDIVYQGLTKPATSEIQFSPSGDDQYDLTFTNRRGTEYSIPYAFAGTSGANNGNFGDDSSNLWFSEVNTNANTTRDIADYQVKLDDYFVVTDTSGALDGADTYVLQFTDVNTDDKTVSVQDASTGSEIKATFTGNESVVGGATGSFTIGGKNFKFWLYNDAGAYKLAVDLNGDGALTDGLMVPVVVQGGGILSLSDAATYSSPWTPSLTTLAKNVDSDVNVTTEWTFTETGATLQVSSLASGGSGYFDSHSVRNADQTVGADQYGTWYELDTPTSDQNTLTITYPQEQADALVYVTGGQTQSSTQVVGSGGARVNPVGAGVAVLDKDVTYDQANMIVVGGPCVNTMAAQLLGNPADCTEGFTQDHAMIKLFSTGKNTALLVAGFEAKDTVAASRVVAESKDYKLAGTSMDVSTADLKSVTVAPSK